MKSSNFEKTIYHVSFSFDSDITVDERNIIDDAVIDFGLSSKWLGRIGDVKCVVSGFDTPECRNVFIRNVNEKIGDL